MRIGAFPGEELRIGVHPDSKSTSNSNSTNNNINSNNKNNTHHTT